MIRALVCRLCGKRLELRCRLEDEQQQAIELRNAWRRLRIHCRKHKRISYA